MHTVPDGIQRQVDYFSLLFKAQKETAEYLFAGLKVDVRPSVLDFLADESKRNDRGPPDGELSMLRIFC